MQKGILIKTGSHCLWKGSYAGNRDSAYSQYLKYKEKFSGFTVEWYEDDSVSEFMNTQVDMPGMIEVK